MCNQGAEYDNTIDVVPWCHSGAFGCAHICGNRLDEYVVSLYFVKELCYLQVVNCMKLCSLNILLWNCANRLDEYVVCILCMRFLCVHDSLND